MSRTNEAIIPEPNSIARQSTGWVIAWTSNDNWDEDHMDFINYDQVHYDIYLPSQLIDGEPHGEPSTIMNHTESEKLGWTVGWGGVYEVGTSLAQGGPAFRAE